MVRLAEAELFTDERGSIHPYMLQLEKEAKGVLSVPSVPSLLSLPSNQHFPSIHLPPSTVPKEGEEEGGEGRSSIGTEGEMTVEMEDMKGKFTLIEGIMGEMQRNIQNLVMAVQGVAVTVPEEGSNNPLEGAGQPDTT